MNEYFYGLAQVSAEISGLPAEWIYAQWSHETGGFSSVLSEEYHNLGGITQVQPNDTPQPDGNCYYMQFNSYESYAEYFGKYLTYYREDGIYLSETIADYITALKNGGYFGDDLYAYIDDCQRILNENFGE